MAIDFLQSKIRKVKNPLMLRFELDGAVVPQGWEMEGYALALMDSLKTVLPAVRFSMGSFVLQGSQGLLTLQKLMARARQLGYYVLLDLPELLSPEAAQAACSALSGQACPWAYDGVVVSAWLGSDLWKRLLPLCREQEKDLFVMVRSANKSASELQDLLTGGRHVHLAAADHVNRYSKDFIGKFGYSQVGCVAAATSAEVSRNLRGKYPQMFLLLDGYDYPNANAKNCSYAFDKLGHGACACVSSGITAAWQAAPEQSPTEAALQAVMRMKKNLNNYLTIL